MKKSAHEKHTLAEFQSKAISAIAETLKRVSQKHHDNPFAQKEISKTEGVFLIQAPTGSGKTLMLGKSLEASRGKLSKPTIWFWFAPFSGLVSQTKDALLEQSGSLRIRDIYKDREALAARDGDIFIQTWASVAANKKDARKVRRTTEDVLSLDDMIMELREKGFHIGVVIDEAHLNFGVSASAAADFFLKILSPDFTILATATPNDEKLKQFEKHAGVNVANHIDISRREVVEAKLNKIGLKVGVLTLQEEDQELIDLEQSTLTAGWSQHCLIKDHLQEKDIHLSPLMLVQVEDQKSGEDDPVARVKKKLLEIGVSENSIAVHTSGEPDPEFHTLAYDPEKEVLIFKVAVATGFDAPRAWTLVSVRPSPGKDFGLQIVGRIMRVHPLIRSLQYPDAILDHGYVFLVKPKLQEGLQAAAEEMKSVKDSISLITDQLDIVHYGEENSEDNNNTIVRRLSPSFIKPKTNKDRIIRLKRIIDRGYISPAALELSEDRQEEILKMGEALETLTETPLFGTMQEQIAPSPKETKDFPQSHIRYPLLDHFDIPSGFIQEHLPAPEMLNSSFVRDVAHDFCQDDSIVKYILKKQKNARLSLKEIFYETQDEERDITVSLSNARIAEKAQLTFQFNDFIDPRLLQKALVNALKERCKRDGIDVETSDLRRAIDLACMQDQGRLKQSIRKILARDVVLRCVDIPKEQYWEKGLQQAAKNIYGVFPPRLNSLERAFSELLDKDESGLVKWWLKNPENTDWATRLILPSGKRFFPDFIVGVKGRSTEEIGLVEIKDDGVTGRLQSDNNTEKIRVHHRSYGRIIWLTKEKDHWWTLVYNDAANRIIKKEVFRIEDLQYTV